MVTEDVGLEREPGARGGQWQWGRSLGSVHCKSRKS